ncbi:MAG TPA: hypothetical protein VJ903_05370 [Clostridia bacterium]|nr:hypothetical protein [Clostridia bacterium]
MVLGKKERVLMDVVYKQASRSINGQCLISPYEMLKRIPYRVDFRETDLEETLNQLVLDNYFEYEKAKKSTGDILYIITLKENGISYQRDKMVSRRKLIFRIITTVIIAALSFSIKYILSAIFG